MKVNCFLLLVCVRGYTSYLWECCIGFRNMTSLNVLVHLFIKRAGIRKLWQRFNRGSWQFIYKSTTDLIHPCHSITVVNYEITVAENGKQLLQHVFLQKTHTI